MVKNLGVWGLSSNDTGITNMSSTLRCLLATTIPAYPPPPKMTSLPYETTRQVKLVELRNEN